MGWGRWGVGWERLAPDDSLLGLRTQQGENTYLLPCDGSPTALGLLGALGAGLLGAPFSPPGLLFLISLASWAPVA